MKSKIKEIHLRYQIKDFETMRRIKETKRMTWEEFVYFAITRINK